MILFIVGNKKDMDHRQIREQRGEEIAKKLGAEYCETSILLEDTVKTLFQKLGNKIYEKREVFKKMNLEKSRIIEDPIENRKKCCF